MGRKNKQLLECRTTFVVGRRFVRRGETLPADHELVRGNELYFRPYEGDGVEDAAARGSGVEAATAAPGEKRDARFDREQASADAEASGGGEIGAEGNEGAESDVEDAASDDGDAVEVAPEDDKPADDSAEEAN